MLVATLCKTLFGPALLHSCWDRGWAGKALAAKPTAALPVGLRGVAP